MTGLPEQLMATATSSLPPDTQRAFDEIMAELEIWTRQHAHFSFSTEQNSPAWPKLLAMGMPAIPLLLEYLQEKPGWWMFMALSAITGANPVPEEHRGKYSLLINDWLKWGRDNGYLVPKPPNTNPLKLSTKPHAGIS